jgi:hypothetical protein
MTTASAIVPAQAMNQGEPMKDSSKTVDRPPASGIVHASHADLPALLDAVELPCDAATVATHSGRRYDIQSGERGDQLTVRSRGGEVVLRVTITDAGPVLAFESAEVELCATRALRLCADEVSVQARGDLRLSSGGALEERVGGNLHTRVAGALRVEAAEVEIQASEGRLAARARGTIALDGEHIALNGDPLPQPFAWSAPAEVDALAEGDDSAGSPASRERRQ